MPLPIARVCGSIAAVTESARPTEIDDPVARPTTSDRAAWSMRALGKRGLPASFVIDGVAYRLTKTIKHDFFAATGFYADPAGTPVVLKMGRTEEFWGVPLLWLGKWLCEREMRFYRRLGDLPNVPAVVGRVGKTGFVHAYVFGNPLSKDRPVPDGFFPALDRLMDELHRRDVAYVDTNKPENILQGDDGLPHLIDFQISYDLHDLGDWPWSRWLLRRFQREDRYHLLKHKKKLRRDQMTEKELADAERRSWVIRLHRFLTKPYFLIRRRTFKRLRESGALLPEGSK
jgi:hypothetical protein